MARVSCSHVLLRAPDFCSGVLLGALSGVIASSQTIHGRGGFTLPPPPDVKAVPVTDDYFGAKMSDNYRWLENANSPETKTFIDAENAYTQRYMEQARIRPQITDDMDALEHVSTWKVPIERGNDLFFREDAGRRGPGLDLCAPRLGGERQAAHRSGAVQPRSQYVSEPGGRVARRNAGGLRRAPGRRG